MNWSLDGLTSKLHLIPLSVINLSPGVLYVNEMEDRESSALHRDVTQLPQLCLI